MASTRVSISVMPCSIEHDRTFIHRNNVFSDKYEKYNMTISSRSSGAGEASAKSCGYHFAILITIWFITIQNKMNERSMSKLYFYKSFTWMPFNI